VFASDAHEVVTKPKASDITDVSRSYLHENFDKYKGGWVRVAGEIAMLSDEDKDEKTISLNGPSSLKYVACYLMNDQDVSNLSEGDYVQIVGKAEAKLLGQAMIYSCYIDDSGKAAKEFDAAMNKEYKSTGASKSKSSLFGTSEIDKDSAIKVTAKEVWKEMQDNQVACKKKYDGNEVALTGTIEDFGTNIYGQEYIILSNGDKYSIGSVQCFFKDDQMDYIASLKKGDKVTLYGIADVGSTSFKLGNSQP
jgi:hypothetical protein